MANPLPLAHDLAGRISPLNDIDWYAIDTTAGPTDSLSLTLEERPVLRMGLELFDGAGNLVASKPLHDLGRERADLTWSLPRGHYLAKLSRPKSSVIFIVDRSDSITPVRGEIVQMAESFARQAGSDEEISLVSMGGEILNDFSSDRQILLAAARQTAEGREGSPLYSALTESIDRLSHRDGAKAIVIVTDGEDSVSSEKPLYELWDKLATTGVRIYTIGYGAAVNLPLEGLLGSTGGDMLRSFSVATGGKFFPAPSGPAMLEIFPLVETGLRGDSDYRIRAEVGGEGQLAVSATGEPITGVSAPEQIELILDASGSMKETMEGGKTRWQVAGEVLHKVIDKLPEGTKVALRVYGHRYPSKPHAVSCTDSELIVPFGPLDRQHLHEVVDGLRPRGETPIGLSLAQLPGDFGSEPGHKIVILVTDGEESCDPNATDAYFPPKVVGWLNDSGISVQVSIVGFGIENSDTRAFLSDLAARGNGAYYDASGSEALTSALDAAFTADFLVTDDSGHSVAKGKVGGNPIGIPAGSWHVSLLADPPRDLGTVKIDAGSLTRLAITKEGELFGYSSSPNEPGGASTSSAAPKVQEATVMPPDGQELRGSWRYPNGAGLDFDAKAYRLLNAAGDVVDQGQYSVDRDVITFSSTDGSVSGLRYAIAVDVLSLFRTDGKTEVLHRH
jgi:Mg-chelatase subunit ChlD